MTDMTEECTHTIWSTVKVWSIFQSSNKFGPTQPKQNLGILSRYGSTIHYSSLYFVNLVQNAFFAQVECLSCLSSVLFCTIYLHLVTYRGIRSIKENVLYLGLYQSLCHLFRLNNWLIQLLCYYFWSFCFRAPWQWSYLMPRNGKQSFLSGCVQSLTSWGVTFSSLELGKCRRHCLW